MNPARPRDRRGRPWDLGEYVRDRPLRWKELADAIANKGGVGPDRPKQLIRESTGRVIFKVPVGAKGHAYADDPKRRVVLLGDKTYYEDSPEYTRHLVERTAPALIQSNRELTTALHSFIRDRKVEDHIGDLRAFLTYVEKTVAQGAGRTVRERVDKGTAMLRYLYPEVIERRPEYAALRQHFGDSHPLFVALEALRQASATRIPPAVAWRRLEAAVVSAVRTLLLDRDFPGTCVHCPAVARLLR